MRGRSSAQSSMPTAPQVTRPEQTVLLCCATALLDDNRRMRLRLAAAQLCDWDYLFNLAERHGMLPLLFSHLNAVCPETVPARHLQQLQERFRKNCISNLLMTSELRSILNLFEAHAITAIPFKGPTLARSAYGDLALRQFHDIDLLLRRDEVLKAKSLLLARGYRPEHLLDEAQEAALLRRACEYTFKGNVYLELQWEIVPASYQFAIDHEGLWQRVGEIDIEGLRLPVLTAEDLLLILCVHGTKHGWMRLGWICDVAETVRAAETIDWSLLFERAQRQGGERMLLLGLRLAADLSDLRLPRALDVRLNADGAVGLLAEAVYQRLFEAEPGTRSVMQSSRFFIRARERASDRMRCAMGMTLSPTASDVMAVKLPRRLFFLYYPLRPLRLGLKYGRHLLGKLTNS